MKDLLLRARAVVRTSNYKNFTSSFGKLRQETGVSAAVAVVISLGTFYATERLDDSERQNDENMACATCFRHSAVLGLPATL